MKIRNISDLSQKKKKKKKKKKKRKKERKIRSIEWVKWVLSVICILPFLLSSFGLYVEMSYVSWCNLVLSACVVLKTFSLCTTFLQHVLWKQIKLKNHVLKLYFGVLFTVIKLYIPFFNYQKKEKGSCPEVQSLIWDLLIIWFISIEGIKFN